MQSLQNEQTLEQFFEPLYNLKLHNYQKDTIGQLFDILWTESKFWMQILRIGKYFCASALMKPNQ